MVMSTTLFALSSEYCFLSREFEAANINYRFGLTRPGIEHTISHTQNKHTNYHIVQHQGSLKLLSITNMVSKYLSDRGDNHQRNRRDGQFIVVIYFSRMV